MTPRDFGRISAQTAKQAMLQRIRSAEKEMMYDEFKDRAGEIVSGTVRRFERSDVIMDLGKFDAIMPSKERVVTEDYNVGDRLRAYVMAVENGVRGPEIILSRSHPNFVRRLFELEVSEINDRTVEIRGLAREAGYRTKIAVHSANEKVDPVGACVGMRGSPGQEHRARTQQREGGHHPLARRAARVHPGGAQARAHQEPDARPGQEGRARSGWTRTNSRSPSASAARTPA